MKGNFIYALGVQSYFFVVGRGGSPVARPRGFLERYERRKSALPRESPLFYKTPIPPYFLILAILYSKREGKGKKEESCGRQTSKDVGYFFPCRKNLFCERPNRNFPMARLSAPASAFIRPIGRTLKPQPCALLLPIDVFYCVFFFFRVVGGWWFETLFLAKIIAICCLLAVRKAEV